MTVEVTQSSVQTVNWTLSLGDMESLYNIVKAGVEALHPGVVVPEYNPDQPEDFMLFQIRNNGDNSVYAGAGGPNYNFAIVTQDKEVVG